jgi:hypothetical protein
VQEGCRKTCSEGKASDQLSTIEIRNYFNEFNDLTTSNSKFGDILDQMPPLNIIETRRQRLFDWYQQLLNA